MLIQSPQCVRTLEELGRIRLSESFFFRDFLYSEISQIEAIPNIPDYPDIAVEAGTKLCTEVLEPIQKALGRISIRSGYRSPAVNAIGNRKKYSCASNAKNHGRHIWDHRDKHGHLGATACIIVNSFIAYYEETDHWEALAWWIHENVPGYSSMCFFPRYAAFNIRWCEVPEKTIKSHMQPRSLPSIPDLLTESREEEYRAFIAQIAG